MGEFVTIKYSNGESFSAPKILYKYRDWDIDYHKTILLENKIYLSPPRDFEDKMDCNLPEKFPSKEDLFDIFLEKSKQLNPIYSEEEHENFANYWAENSPLANPSELSRLIREFNDDFNNRFGVLSVTEDPSNKTMWVKYANNFRGICIGFDTEKLFSVVGGGGEVIYQDDLPVIDFINDDFSAKHVKNIFSKGKDWAFEKEYRLHKFWSNNPSKEDRNIEMPKDCIVEIILGKGISDENRNSVSRLVQEKYPKAKLINMPNR